MTDQPAKTYAPSADMAANAHADKAKYDAMYAASINDPDAFWAEHGKRVDWIKPFSTVKNVSFAPGNVDIKCCLLYTSPSPRDLSTSRMPSSA